eukprot:1251212-Prymnesium_polylepis.2
MLTHRDRPHSRSCRVFSTRHGGGGVGGGRRGGVGVGHGAGEAANVERLGVWPLALPHAPREGEGRV